MATVHEIASEADFNSKFASLSSDNLAVVYFHAPWAAPCKQMSTVLSTLASTYSSAHPITFLSLNAEEVSEIAEQYDVTAVPFIVLQKDGKTLETISGSDATKVRLAVEKYAGASGAVKASGLPPEQTVTRKQDEPTTNGANGAGKSLAQYAPTSSDPQTTPDLTRQETSKEELHARLAELVKAAPVMLFMKGTPSAPQCGFSRQTVGLLRESNIRYGFFNILADDDIRQGLKVFSDWPTFPQLYVDGEFVGGLDIVKEEFENNEDFLKEYAAR